MEPCMTAAYSHCSGAFWVITAHQVAIAAQQPTNDLLIWELVELLTPRSILLLSVDNFISTVRMS